MERKMVREEESEYGKAACNGVPEGECSSAQKANLEMRFKLFKDVFVSPYAGAVNDLPPLFCSASESVCDCCGWWVDTRNGKFQRENAGDWGIERE